MSNKVEFHPVEQRRKTRISLPEPPVVYDAHSGETIGQIVNLSVDGMMLAGPVSIAPGTLHQLCIQVEQEDIHAQLLVGVESLWCQDVNNSGTCWTGFQIIDISTEHQEMLNTLIDE